MPKRAVKTEAEPEPEPVPCTRAQSLLQTRTERLAGPRSSSHVISRCDSEMRATFERAKFVVGRLRGAYVDVAWRALVKWPGAADARIWL